MSTAVETKKVTGRRKLEFATLNDVLADAEMLARASKIRNLGNWTPGQIFKHLAIVMNGQIDGVPLRPPWVFRMIGRFILKRRIIYNGMPAGFQLPENARTVLIPTDSTTLEEGLENLRAAVRRLNADSTRAPNPFFGPVTAEESNQIQCRHAELHLSFLLPE